MPFYAALKVRDHDSAVVKRRKRRTADRLLQLRAAMDAHFSESGCTTDHGGSVKIATWNLREFGGSKYAGRDDECLYYIAEIISRFDIVALQEVRADLSEFFQLKRILGPDWEYIATDVTDGNAGNGERMLFVYNRREVQFKNIAGELTLKESGKIRAAFGERIKLEDGLKVELPATAASLSGTYDARIRKVRGGHKLAADLEIPLPPHSHVELPEGSRLVITKNTRVSSPGRGKARVNLPMNVAGPEYRMRFPENSFDDSLRQFARTPYMISFQAGWLKLNLCTVHIYYGDASDAGRLEQRRSEIEQLTRALAKKARGEFKYDDKSFLGVLGDFNIIGAGHPTMQALESNDFLIPEKLKSIPGSNVARDKAYDQIAFWQPGRNTGYAGLDVLAANVFDFFEHVFSYAEEPEYRRDGEAIGLQDSSRFSTWRTYKMSDHLPMWVELRSDFGAAYLRTLQDD